MTRKEVRRRLAMTWWRQVGFTLVPLLVMGYLFGDGEPVLPVLQMPLFIGALVSLFFSLPMFSAYKRALVATEAALGRAEEPGAWQELTRRRDRGFLAAGLPAWIAALAVLVGLNTVALFLLAMSSLVLLYLYRIPRQLG
ncbi:MFS transporter [Metapseudomonas lalkuanensis]|uniref:MFS transporter n=1 Tax=Metapseudomonas lalkuanensis TaxID=2604832 RepID=A0A5J6QET6_9GAMM|nr:MFS transporter [Pseudomonas lalkuanensis]QEY61114.1 MFS transporter [Pseudomonas lalkuanensis]